MKKKIICCILTSMVLGTMLSGCEKTEGKTEQKVLEEKEKKDVQEENEESGENDEEIKETTVQMGAYEITAADYYFDSQGTGALGATLMRVDVTIKNISDKPYAFYCSEQEDGLAEITLDDKGEELGGGCLEKSPIYEEDVVDPEKIIQPGESLKGTFTFDVYTDWVGNTSDNMTILIEGNKNQGGDWKAGLVELPIQHSKTKENELLRKQEEAAAAEEKALEIYEPVEFDGNLEDAQYLEGAEYKLEKVDVVDAENSSQKNVIVTLTINNINSDDPCFKSGPYTCKLYVDGEANAVNSSADTDGDFIYNSMINPGEKRLGTFTFSVDTIENDSTVTLRMEHSYEDDEEYIEFPLSINM